MRDNRQKEATVLDWVLAALIGLGTYYALVEWSVEPNPQESTAQVVPK